MKILVLTEYVSHRPWAPDRWAIVLARELAHRGHNVTLACDGRDDAHDLDGLDPIVRRPTRDRSARQPLRFATWAGRILRDADHDASVSFTSLAPGDLWIPVGPTEPERLKAMISPNLLSVGIDLVGRPWIPSASVAALRARLGRSARHATRRRLGASQDTNSGLGYAGLVDVGSTHDRDSVRRALGVGLDAPAALVSALRIGSPGLDELLGGLSQVCSRRGAAKTPVLVLIGHAQYTLMQRVVRFGVEEHVRIIGAAQRIEHLLSACDAAIAPFAAATNSTGRFVADSLCCGTPVLCAPDAPGAELIRAENGLTPGRLLPGRTEPEWRAALECLSDKSWLDSCSAAAADAGAMLTTDAIAERMETLLEKYVLRQ